MRPPSTQVLENLPSLPKALGIVLLSSMLSNFSCCSASISASKLTSGTLSKTHPQSPSRASEVPDLGLTPAVLLTWRTFTTVGITACLSKRLKAPSSLRFSHSRVFQYSTLKQLKSSTSRKTGSPMQLASLMDIQQIDSREASYLEAPNSRSRHRYLGNVYFHTRDRGLRRPAMADT